MALNGSRSVTTYENTLGEKQIAAFAPIHLQKSQLGLSGQDFSRKKPLPVVQDNWKNYFIFAMLAAIILK
ncbi:hypothetical protein ACT691_20560 [Vibrio metschnikovii]